MSTRPTERMFSLISFESHCRSARCRSVSLISDRLARMPSVLVSTRARRSACTGTVQQHDEAISVALEVSGVKRGHLRFGCGPHTSICIIPHLLRAFLALYPNVEVSVTTADDHTLLNELRTGRGDVVLMTLPVDAMELEVDPLWQYEMVFVVAPGDPMSRLRTVAASDLQGKPFILYRRANVVETAIRHFCSEVGFEPKVVMSDDQADSIKELVKLKLGISLLPLWSVSQDIRHGKLRMLRLRDRHLIHQMGLIYRKSIYRTAVLTALSSVAHQWQKWLPMAKDVSPIITTGKAMTAP